jgi:PAS domain-containing protein
LEERERVGRVTSELNLIRKDGSKFLGEISSTFYQDVSGDTKAAVTIRDVTERRRAEETLRQIIEGTAAVTGGDFFRSLARHLAQALQFRYSFVAECTDAAKTAVHTLAFWAGEGFANDVTFPLRGTPCEAVVGGEICCYPERLQALFPDDIELVTLHAESYLGVPLRNVAGEILGHLVVMDDKPIHDLARHVPLLRIFAARAGAELERNRAQEALKGSEERLRLLLDINYAIGRYLNRDELFGALAGCLKTLVPTERFGIELPIEGDKLQGHILSTIPTGGEPTQPTVLPALGTACNWVMENRAAFVAASRDEFRERFPVTFDVMSSQGMESLCALPLVSGDRAHGGCSLWWPRKAPTGPCARNSLSKWPAKSR